MNLIPRSNNLFFNDMFEDFFEKRTMNNFKCDIYEKEDKYYIEMDVPGYTKDDITIEYDNGYLTVNVLREKNNLDDSKNYIITERNKTNFNRSFYVGDVEFENIKANFKNGCLIIEVPKEIIKSNKKTILIEEN